MMKTNEEFILEPLCEGQKFDETCWIAVDSQSNKQTKVIFYSASHDEEETFSSLKEFAKFVFEDNFNITKNADVEVDLNDTKCTKYGCIIKEVDELDEDNRKNRKVLEASAQIIDVYKPTSIDKVAELVALAKKDLTALEKNSMELYQDNGTYKKSPDAYYGVSRFD